MESIILPISSQGQITIPKKWREDFLKGKSGNKVVITKVAENEFKLEPAPDIDAWLTSLRKGDQ